MSLTDTFVKQVKPIKSNGDKYADGGGMYLLVKATEKYWRMDYRYLNKRKTLALGVYPEISLAKARKRREEARELLADGIDPAQNCNDPAKPAHLKQLKQTPQPVSSSPAPDAAGGGYRS